MERELIYLLHDLCIKWGICIPPDCLARIAKTEQYNAIDFARDVVEAEGMDPDNETGWVNRIVEQFKVRFGSDEITASTFKDRVRGIKESWRMK